MNKPAPEREILRDIDFPATDTLLRDDVKQLGNLVGEILSEQLGPDFLAEVERIRKAAIRRREAAAPIDELVDELDDVPAEQYEDLVRAFATYFQAVNLAERVHRIRRRRDYQRAGAHAQPGGLLDVLTRLRDDGVTFEQLTELLPKLRIEPVFTAHPTEAMRRALLEKEKVIVRALIDDIDRMQTPSERRADRSIIRTALTAGWQTEEAAPEKPTVADEAEHVGYYLSDTLYRVLPVFYEALEDACVDVYGKAPEMPRILRFGTWVGGDMDGNPNVGADTVRGTLRAQRELVLAAYRGDVRRLSEILSQSVSRVTVNEEVDKQLDAYRQTFPDAASRYASRRQDMPYREFLHLIGERLRRTEKDDPAGYPDANAFIDDLQRIASSLLANNGEHAGYFALRRLKRRAKTFGFHLATLDLRQDSAIHDTAIAQLLGDADYPERSLEDRLAALRKLLTEKIGVPDQPELQRTLDVFRTVAEALPRYGSAAFGPYIVSMSRSAADALAVLALARTANCIDSDNRVPIDVAPLFETVADLQAAPDVLRSLFADPLYRDHLKQRSDLQWVMLGYSDSAKDGGLIASRWSLQRAQLVLTALAQEAGIAIRFFHGRGGSLSRGGSKTERAVIAAPRGSVDGVLRVTEQGEVIHRKYGIRALALRNLEQATGAVMRATLRPRPPEPREDRWRAIAAELAQSSRQTYRGLVYDDPRFPDYFRLATPIDVIERLRIGSRPAKRAGSGGIERLRAIPWVFAWSQNRAGLTAWYGAGSGLSAAIEQHGVEVLSEMARDWPFFTTMLDDLEMVLAKADIGIFERYSLLAGDLHEPMFAQITAEFQRTHDAILTIKNSDWLLAGDQRLRQSIRLRNPYVDPISLLQVELLAQWRSEDRPDGALFHALVATVNGIAAGIQNTG